MKHGGLRDPLEGFFSQFRLSPCHAGNKEGKGVGKSAGCGPSDDREKDRPEGVGELEIAAHDV